MFFYTNIHPQNVEFNFKLKVVGGPNTIIFLNSWFGEKRMKTLKRTFAISDFLIKTHFSQIKMSQP